MTAIVRPYQTSDREALLQIGADTAFFGAPIEAYMEDRRVFIDSFYAYYTDYEPQHTWIAADGNHVLGFLTGCTNTQAHDRILSRDIFPGLPGVLYVDIIILVRKRGAISARLPRQRCAARSLRRT